MSTENERGDSLHPAGWAALPWDEEKARAGWWVRWPVWTRMNTEPELVEVGYMTEWKAWVWRSGRGWLKCTDEGILERVGWVGPINPPPESVQSLDG